MLVVKQCKIVKNLTQLHLSMLILIAGFTSNAAVESEGLSLKVINGGISEFFPNNENASPPTQFPKPLTNSSSVQGTPIIHLGYFLNNTDETIINKIKKMIDDVGKDKLPHTMTVILNDNDTHNDTRNTSNINLSKDISANGSSNSIASNKPQVKSVKLYNNELSKKSTIIFLVSVALVSTFFYILLVSLRKILERKYGDKELLVQNDLKPEDFY